MEWGASVLTTDPQLLKDITEGYEADPYFLNIVDHLKKEKEKNHTTPKDMKFLLSRFVWDDTTGLLYKTLVDTQLLCIPRVNDLTLHRIIEAHDIPLGGHFGRDKTLANLAKNFFWPGMTTDVEDYVKSCNNCQKNKVVKRNPLGLLYPHDRPGGRWETIALDFIVQLPTTKSGKYDAILTVVDCFSKRTHFIPCNGTADATETAQLLRNHVIKLHGYPQCIISDRGSVFTSNIWRELFKSLKARQNLSSSYHPQTDGMSEKQNDIIECCIRAFTNYQQDDWDQFLPDFELAINASKNGSSGLSPQELDTGLIPFLPLAVTYEKSSIKSVNDLLDRMQEVQAKANLWLSNAQEKQALYANRKRGDEEFQEGDFVMLNSDFVYDPIHTARQSRKLAQKALGPFRIEKKISRVAYKLFIPKEDNIGVHPVIHIANLKKYIPTQERFLNRENYVVPQPLKDSEDVTVYEDILSLKWERKKRYFLIKWEGYDDPSWEKEELLRDSPDFIPHLEEYLQRVQDNKIKPLRASKRKHPKARIK